MFKVKERIEKVKSIAHDKGCEVSLIINSDNLTYLTGIDYSIALIINLDNLGLYVLRLDYDRALSELGNLLDIIAFSKYEKPLRRDHEKLVVSESLTRCIVNELVKKGVKSLCTDFSEKIIRDVKECEINIVDINDDIIELRAVKDYEEINAIRKAVEITEKVLSELLSKSIEGLRERELVAEIYKLVIINEGDNLAFTPIVASGINTANPHHKFTNRKLGREDIVILDLGAKYMSYCSDITRTISIGSVNSKLKDIYYAVLEAQKKSIINLRSQVNAVNIDEIAREVLKEYGFDKYFIHGLGHGVGINIHEKPLINPASRDVLKKNNIVTIEPGIYIKDYGGIRIEDMILINDEGFTVLTSFPKDLV